MMKFFMKVIICSFLISVSLPSFGIEVFGKPELVGVYYYKNIFGQVHQNPSKYSSGLTTVSCGHPIKVYQVVLKDGGKRSLFSNVWRFVKVGPYDGYIRDKTLSKTRVKCFQDLYPKFFNKFNLDLSELYYWGRLYDQYLQGRSKVR